jgi:hypothetical protein
MTEEGRPYTERKRLSGTFYLIDWPNYIHNTQQINNAGKVSVAILQGDAVAQDMSVPRCLILMTRVTAVSVVLKV